MLRAAWLRSLRGRLRSAWNVKLGGEADSANSGEMAERMH